MCVMSWPGWQRRHVCKGSWRVPPDPPHHKSPLVSCTRRLVSPFPSPTHPPFPHLCGLEGFGAVHRPLALPRQRQQCGLGPVTPVGHHITHLQAPGLGGGGAPAAAWGSGSRFGVEGRV
jgi:hypothetical protein